MIKIKLRRDSSKLQKIPIPGKPGMYRLEGGIADEYPKEKRRSYNELTKIILGEDEK